MKMSVYICHYLLDRLEKAFKKNYNIVNIKDVNKLAGLN